MVYRMRLFWLVMLLLLIGSVGCIPQPIPPQIEKPLPVQAQANGSPSICRAPYALLDPLFPYQNYKAGLAGVNSYGISVLWNTFGNKFDNLRSELADPRVHSLEVSLINETCYTRGDCGSYEILASVPRAQLTSAINRDDPKLKARVVSEAQILANLVLPLLRPGVSFRINPLLETHQTPQTVLHLWSWISPIFQGRAELVWNPVGANASNVPGFSFAEAHGPTPNLRSPCIANTDGAILAGSEVASYLQDYGIKCADACVWVLNDSCAAPNQPRLDPRRRPCRLTGEFRSMLPGMLEAQKYHAPPPWAGDDDKSLNGCDKVCPNPDGDKRGFLAKASDVAVYGWTILFPAEWSFTKVETWKAGRPVGKWRYYYRYAPDKSNRAVWRAEDRPGAPIQAKSFPPNLVVRGTTSAGKVQCWKVHNPQVRND